MKLHTPGPWTLKTQGEANEYCILGENNRWIMALQQNGEMSVEQQDANGRLVEAAPEMLEALEKVQRYLGRSGEAYLLDSFGVTEAIEKAGRK